MVTVSCFRSRLSADRSIDRQVIENFTQILRRRPPISMNDGLPWIEYRNFGRHPTDAIIRSCG